METKYFKTFRSDFEEGEELICDIDGEVLGWIYNYSSYNNMLKGQFYEKSRKEDFLINQEFFNIMSEENKNSKN